MTNRTTLRKQPLAFFFGLFLLLAIAIAAPVHSARADNLSQGMELYQQKKFSQAIPYLEKAAQEGHEEAIAALDVIYAADTASVPADPSSSVNGKTAAKGQSDKPADVKQTKKAGNAAASVVEEPEGKPQYDRATVTEDKQEVEDRSFMRKLFFLGTAAIIILLWIVQFFLFRKMRNQNFRKMTPEELAAELKKNKNKK